MAFPVIQHLVGGQNASPLGDLQFGLTTEVPNATATTWTFTGPGMSTTRVVFTGSFIVLGGVVQDGVVTGFDVFVANVKVLTGSGYSLTDNAILKARDAAVADDYTIFYSTFFREVLEVGSADTDRMYGSTKAGKFLGLGGDDFLYGGPGAEVMKGGDGNDWVEGRGLGDKLFGNAGADIFALTNVDKNNDPAAVFAVHRIKDFDRKEDTIFLDAARFTAIDSGPLDKSEFGWGRKAETPEQHFVFRRKTGDLFYDGDGLGGAKKVLIAELDPGLKLRAHHFDADFVA
jgi:Ca2+-binding RTX toxin-like protein